MCNGDNKYPLWRIVNLFLVAFYGDWGWLSWIITRLLSALEWPALPAVKSSTGCGAASAIRCRCVRNSQVLLHKLRILFDAPGMQLFEVFV